jgi:hypothetical protein
VNARAFTVGEQIVFAEHQYAAGSESGKRLLAHELVHTIQQRGGVNHGVLAVSSPTDSLEREADAAATAVLDQRDATVIDQHHAAAIDQHHPIAQVVTATAPALLARAPDDPQPTTNPPAPTPTPSGDAGTGTSSSAAPGNVTPAEPTATPDAGQKPPAPPKKVCLTFDDGPQDPGTMDVLNGLGSSIKATFFLQGSKMVPTERLMQPNDPMLPAATKQAELVAQILAKGHQIANHTFWHVPFKKTQYDALTQKPQAEQDKTITEGFTKNLAYFQRLYEDHKEAFAARGITSFPGFQLGRLPGQGKDYPPYVALVEGLGLKHVAWNAEFAPKGGLGAPLGTADWKGVQGLDSEIKGNGCTGNNWILLLHDPLWDGKQALLQSLIEKLRTGCNAEFGVLNASGACS